MAGEFNVQSFIFTVFSFVLGLLWEVFSSSSMELRKYLENWRRNNRYDTVWRGEYDRLGGCFDYEPARRKRYQDSPRSLSHGNEFVPWIVTSEDWCAYIIRTSESESR